MQGDEEEDEGPSNRVSMTTQSSKKEAKKKGKKSKGKDSKKGAGKAKGTDEADIDGAIKELEAIQRHMKGINEAWGKEADGANNNDDDKKKKVKMNRQGKMAKGAAIGKRPVGEMSGVVPSVDPSAYVSTLVVQ